MCIVFYVCAVHNGYCYFKNARNNAFFQMKLELQKMKEVRTFEHFNKHRRY